MEREPAEIKIGQSSIFVDEDNIIHGISIGDIDEELANNIKQAFLELANKIEGKVNYIIDVNNAGNSSPGARRVWKEVAEHPKINKLAFIGLHPVARLVASFTMGVAGKKQMKFLKTEQEAIAWFKE